MKHLLSNLFAIVLLDCFLTFVGITATFDGHNEAARWLLEARAAIGSGSRFEALERLHSALMLANQTDQHLTAALALANIGEVYRLHGNPTEALSYYREALERYQLMSHENGIQTTRKQIAELASLLEEKLSVADRDKLIDQAIERVRAGQRDQDKIQDAMYTDYLERVRKAIVRSWTYPAAIISSRGAGSVEVAFTILQDGHLEDARVIQPAEQLSVGLAAIEAVKAAAPFATIPEQLGIKRLNVEFTFNYVFKQP